MDPKRLMVPPWVTEDQLIGYTGDFTDHPSVYYKHGHLTTRHRDKDNIGWVGARDWRCLFFGNLPVSASEVRDEYRANGKQAYAKKFESPEWSKQSYCDSRTQQWRPVASEAHHRNCILVEVWQTGPDGVLIHPSRGRFTWVPDPERRRQLDMMARGPQSFGDRLVMRHVAAGRGRL